MTITQINTLILFMFLGQICAGQILESFPDKEGEAESFEKMNDGVIKNEVSYVNISGGHWESRDSLTKIKLMEFPIVKFTNTSAIFSFGKISFKITASPFDTLGHKFTYTDPKQPYLVLIDNKTFWGTDGGMPKERISSITYQIGNKTFKLPDSALTNLFEPNFCYSSENIIKCHCGVYQSLDKKRLYIYMLNSDGAGGYEVTWVIEDNKYLTRIVDYGF